MSALLTATIPQLCSDDATGEMVWADHLAAHVTSEEVGSQSIGGFRGRFCEAAERTSIDV